MDDLKLDEMISKLDLPELLDLMRQLLDEIELRAMEGQDD